MMGAMFDLDDFIVQCEAARQETEPRRAIREVLERVVSAPGEVARALSPTQGGFSLLHHTDDLTILHVVWAPGMQIYPHDHRMWAAIGIYGGQEDNAFYRRSGPGEKTLVESGGKELVTGDTVVLGDDTIHGVSNPRDGLTGAIHIYGGDFVAQPRSQWGPGPVEERPYDIEDARRQFADANARWRSEGPDASAG
jgi:predicted metal-dependent enzyme (double-stranded beta helix superfamily)